MKKINSFVWAAGFAAAIGTAALLGQDNNPGGDANAGGRRNRGGQGGPGGGNFDPAQMRQQMIERNREQLGVKDDAEWKIVQERIGKVYDARREVPAGRGAFAFGRGGGGGATGGGTAAGAAGGGGGGGRGGAFGAPTLPEGEALQKAIEANATADELKSKLANYRDAVKQKEAKLEKAQTDLRQVLSVKQEAQAVLIGLLK